MKIDNSLKPLPGVSPVREEHTRAVSADGPAPARVREETPAPRAADAASGTADPARVERIKQAIAEGRFTVNAEAVADKLIESTRELLRHRGA